MNKGDKLICKKDYKYRYEEKTYVLYKNDIYRIDSIDDVYSVITFENLQWAFFLDDLDDDFSPYLYKYFYTPEELRQLKLESL